MHLYLLFSEPVELQSAIHHFPEDVQNESDGWFQNSEDPAYALISYEDKTPEASSNVSSLVFPNIEFL